MKQKSSELFLYLKLIAILALPAIFISWYSFYDKELTIAGVTLEKTDIAGYFKKVPTVPVLQQAIENQKDTVICDTTSQRILFFGDSMLEGLSRRMKQYAAANHHELLNVIWYSSSSKVWAEHKDTLVRFINEFHPTYIMICMGGNELFVKDLDNRDRYVKTILRTIGSTPYVWIGPPNWKEDAGINRIYCDNAGAHRFFPSKRLKYQRKSDGAHPTYASAVMWMDSVACWMNDSIHHRILMKMPAKDAPSTGKTVLLQPLK
jgi:hypothetical protein